jgi:DNA-directed RNA polymerase specialized sigma24 family protein
VARPAPIKAKPLRERVEESYTGFIAGDVNEFDFLTIARKFASVRVHYKFRGTDQFGQTEEDIVQIAISNMWRSLHSVNLEKGSYYTWFGRAINNAVEDAKNGSRKDAERYAPYFLTNKEGEEYDNPGMCGKIKFKHNKEYSYQNPMPQFQRKLPDHIQGTDLKICQYIREGFDYAHIGEILSMSEGAVERRIARMRKKIEETKLKT